MTIHAQRLAATLTVLAAGVAERLDDARTEARADDRGGITSQTIVIAVMAALAIAVGAIITALVTGRANSINLG